MHPTFTLEIRSCDAWHWRIGDGLMFFLHPYYTVSFVSGCRLSFDWVGVWFICDLGLSLFPYSSLFPFSFFSCPYFLLQGCLIGTSPQKQRLKSWAGLIGERWGFSRIQYFRAFPCRYVHTLFLCRLVNSDGMNCGSVHSIFSSSLQFPPLSFSPTHSHFFLSFDYFLDIPWCPMWVNNYTLFLSLLVLTLFVWSFPFSSNAVGYSREIGGINVLEKERREWETTEKSVVLNTMYLYDAMLSLLIWSA